jgi:H+/Cl- antiporter ClcA
MANIQVVSDLSGVQVTPVDKVRAWIAYIVVGVFFSLVGFLAINGWVYGREIDEIVRIVTIVSTALGGIVGIVLGFYFRYQSQSQSQ